MKTFIVYIQSHKCEPLQVDLLQMTDSFEFGYLVFLFSKRRNGTRLRLGQV